MIKIEALTAFSDNYIWLIKNIETKQCAVIDPGDATPVLTWLKKHPDWQLTDILITHHHQDHIGGISLLKSHTSAKITAPNNPSIPHIDCIASNNQLISVIGRTAQVIAVPGHTLDHIVYFFPQQIDYLEPWLFSGDTLFAGGCGRVFEGTMEQMCHSLQSLAQLPPETLVFAAHEYTISNLRFALAVEPNNLLIKNRLANCLQIREQQKSTLPSTLNIEQQTNPFLRCHQIDVINAAKKYSNTQTLQTPIEIFANIREWKNNF